MPPYAIPQNETNSNNDVRRMSIESVEPILKRYLSFIDERFVRFEDMVIIHECPPNHHHTPQSERELWYSAKELTQFRKNANRQGRLLQQRRPSSSCRPLPRGLELQTAQGLQRCLKNRLSAMAVVLELQYATQQKEHLVAASASSSPSSSTSTDVHHHNNHNIMEDLYPDTADDDSSVMIAKAYHEVTRHCQLEALDIGLRDHMETVENQNGQQQQQGEDSQCNSSSPCLNMPTWLSALLQKRASQQQYWQQEQSMLLL